MRVAVIGAGAAGLLAALRARELGAEVTLFEAGARAGGVIATSRQGEWLVERGPNTLAEPHPDVRRMLDIVGFQEILIRPDAAVKKRYVLFQGKPVPVPSRGSDLVSSPLLTISGRLRLLKEPFTERGPANPEETVDSFVRRRLGAEVADRIIDPYVAGTSGGDLRQLLARYVLPRLVEYEHVGGSILKGAMRSRRNARRRGTGGGGIWSCRDGLSDVVARLARHVGSDLRLDAPVRSVTATATGFDLVTDGAEASSFDRVIVTVPAPALGQIAWNDAIATRLALTAAMPQGAMGVVSLGFRRDDVEHPLDGFGVLVPTIEQRRILGTFFPSSLFAGRAPAGHVLLTTFVGGGRRPELVRHDDDSLVTMVQDELRDMLGVRGTAVFRDVTRWHEAMPQTVAGHAGRLAAAAEVEQGTPGLAFAGAWRDGLGVGDVMLGGLRAAERVMDRPARAPGGVS